MRTAEQEIEATKDTTAIRVFKLGPAVSFHRSKNVVHGYPKAVRKKRPRTVQDG